MEIQSLKLNSNIHITLNAFSFLQKKMKQNGHDCYNVDMAVPKGLSVSDLIAHLGLVQDDVEGVFVNGTIVKFNKIIENGDRVGLLPPGTPGPYRVMLGIVQNIKKSEFS